MKKKLFKNWIPAFAGMTAALMLLVTPVWAGSISDYLEDALLDHVLEVGAYTPAATIYIGLSTADPLDDASGIAEPAGGNYARETIAFDAAASRIIESTALITYNQASGAWGTITHWFIADHLSNTTWGTDVDLLAHGSLSVSKAVVSGNTPSIAANEVDVSFSAGEVSDYLANKYLDFAFRNQAFAQPGIWLFLATANAADDDTGSTITDVSGNNYSRLDFGTWNAASGGASSNNGAATFATPSGSWGLVTAAGLVDASTAGNVLFYENTISEQTPDSGDTVRFADGDLDITLD